MDADLKKSDKYGWVFLIAGLIGALIVGWIIFPALLYSKKEQPIHFSHAKHGPDSDAGMSCEDCHFFYEDGSFSGIPKIAKCIECHEDAELPLSDSEEEEKLFTDYIVPNKEIPWLVYSRQPECVYFPHMAHVKMADIECNVCHGEMAKQDSMPVYKVNRLTGYSIDIWGRNIAGLKKNTWDRMKMNDCAECHTEHNKENNNACFVCHK